MKPLLAVALLAALCSSAAPAPKVSVQPRSGAVVPWQPEADVVASKTRRALAVATSSGPVAVWAAPTRSGGECWVVDIQALPPDRRAACSASPSRDYVIRPWQSETAVGDETLRLLSARVTPAVASVEVRFADGGSDVVRPRGGFLLHELGADDEPTLVVARDAAGNELRRRPMPGPRSFRRELPFPSGRYRTVIELESGTLAVAPGTNGSVCRQTIYRGSRSWGCGPDPSRLAPDEIDVERWKGVLVGSAGGRISRLEVWYEGGAAARIPIIERYVLFEVPRRRVPGVLVGFDERGSLVARRRLGQVP